LGFTPGCSRGERGRGGESAQRSAARGFDRSRRHENLLPIIFIF